MTKSPSVRSGEVARRAPRAVVEPGHDRCRWCRHVLARREGPGRPREFCSQRCRQWDWVSRQRAVELNLSENELVMTRAELDDLKDRLYVLECAVTDARHDLQAPRHTVKSLRELLEWVLESAESLQSQDEPGSLIFPLRP